MREIKIATIIMKKRKEKGVTQDELAAYIGVTKAAISKWETGQSYPDITFLPVLAAYFNISVDELIGYEPQMTKEDIKSLYRKICDEFTKKPFDEVLIHCREVMKKYYACFPLLFQIGVLYVNHSMLAGNPETTNCMNKEAEDLFRRVKEECDDVELAKQALVMEAYCCLLLGKPDQAVELLETQEEQHVSKNVLLASAYQMTGRPEQALAALQIDIYKEIISAIGAMPSLLMMYVEKPDKFDDCIERMLLMDEAFGLRSMHPAVMLPVFLTCAQGYSLQGRIDKALDMLETYVGMATDGIYPLRLKGNEFFDHIEKWLNGLDAGVYPPRSEQVIKQSIVESIIKNPAFGVLSQEDHFRNLVKRLENEFH